METMHFPPGPKGHFLVGNLPERRRDPLGFFMDLSQQYGPITRFKIGHKNLVYLDDSDAIRHVLVENQQNYGKGFGYDRLEEVLGKGILTSEGEEWRRNRKLMQPAFHRTSLELLGSQMIEATETMISEWERKFFNPEETKQPVAYFDLLTEMMRLTMRIAGLTLLSTDVEATESQEVTDALTFLLKEANNRILTIFPVPLGIPTPRNLKSKRSLAVLNKVVYRMIQEHREKPDKQDLLAMLLSAKDENGEPGLTDQQVRDEVMTIFLAGHETTANALTWTLYLLSKNPQVEATLMAELEGVLQGRDATLADLPHLKYTEAVLQESMRLLPPAWLIAREAIQADRILGFAIQPKDIIVICSYVTHRNPWYWENPEGFDPSRFLNKKDLESKPKFAYFPFGGGPRQCIGNHFAMMESMLVLTRIVSRYRLWLKPGFKVEPEPNITLRPKNGMMMSIKKRN